MQDSERAAQSLGVALKIEGRGPPEKGANGHSRDGKPRNPQLRPPGDSNRAGCAVLEDQRLAGPRRGGPKKRDGDLRSAANRPPVHQNPERRDRPSG
jgi:hypothetical protein